MKLRTLLVISLVVNVVLLATIGYIASLDVKVKTPPGVILINTAAPSLPWADLLVAE
jgi:hypothetical protein